MKILLTLIIVINVTTYSAKAIASEGGNSSGGGGANAKDTNSPIIPINPLGLSFSKIKESTEDKKIIELVQEDKLKAEHCGADKAALIPEMPPVFKDKFKLFVQQAKFDYPMSENSLPFSKSNEDAVPLSNFLLCSSAPLLRSYQSFILGAYDLSTREENDGIGKYLIEKAANISGPIPVVITERKLHHKATGGSIEESTWFEKDKGIYWTYKDGCQGLHCFGARTDGSLLVHETVLYLLSKALKEKYPENQVWHDIRFLEKQSSKPFTDSDNILKKIFLSKTSESAAFLEGLANALELRTYQEEHPFMERHFGMYRIWKNSCYFPDNYRFNKIPFQAPKDSEVYVSSALKKFLEKSQNASFIKDGTLKVNSMYSSPGTNVQRMREIIDTILVSRPVDINEFAAAFDKTDNSDLARKWLKEYFFIDYKTQKKVGEGFSINDQNQVCAKENDFYQNSFSYIADKEQDAIEENARFEHSKNVQTKDLENDIDNILNFAKVDINKNQEELDGVPATCAKLINLGLCNQSKNGVILIKFIEDIYDIIRKVDSDKLVSESTLESTILNLCIEPQKREEYLLEYSVSDLLKNLERYQAEAIALKMLKTVPGSKEHFDRVQHWVELRIKLLNTVDRIKDILIIYKTTLQHLKNS